MKITSHPTLCRLGFALLLAVGASPFAARGQNYNPPGQISYQSFVTDANGVPLGMSQPKNYDIIFKIYTSASASSAMWAEVQTVVVDRGYFSVLLGQGANAGGSEPWTNNLTAYFVGPSASDRYIGITVKGVSTPDAEIQPRLRLLATPYSFLAANANVLVNNAGQTLISGASGTPAFYLTNAAFYGTPTFNNGYSASGNVGGNPTFTGSPTFSGNPIFSGTPSLTNGFSMGGNISGSPTNTGAPTFSGVVNFRNSLYLNDREFLLHTDANNGVGWYGTGKTFAGQAVGGPVLYGATGGALGAMPQKIALSWDSTNNVVLYSNATIKGSATVNGSLMIDAANLNDGSSVSPGLTFGLNGGEGISSRRTTNSVDNFGLNFYTSYARRMTILNNGRVGIAMANPAYTLDVAGDFHCTTSVRSQDAYTRGFFFCYWDGAYVALNKDGSSYAYWSDLRLKQNVNTIPSALKAVQKLRGVNFNWSEAGRKHLTRDIEQKWKSDSGTPEDDQKLWDKKRTEKYAELSATQTGFIAQEFEQVFPDWVTTDSKTGLKQIDTRHLDAVLVNAIKEQQDQIESQQRKIVTLEERLQALEKLIKSGAGH